jgi:hypothetical protein
MRKMNRLLFCCKNMAFLLNMANLLMLLYVLYKICKIKIVEICRLIEKNGKGFLLEAEFVEKVGKERKGRGREGEIGK